MKKRNNYSKEQTKILLVWGIALDLLLAALLIFTLAVVSAVTNAKLVYSFDGKEIEYNKRDVILDGVSYVDMDGLSEAYSVDNQKGGSERLYSINGTSVKIENDKEVVFVNSFEVVLSREAVVDQNRCLVPLDSLKLILLNADVESSKKQVDIKLNGDAYFVAKDVAIAYNNDMNNYKKYIQTKDKNYLMLVNKDNELGQSYEPVSLKTIPEEYRKSNEISLEETTLYALEAMMLDMRSAGVDDCYVTSAYRSYSYQEWLFGYYIEQEMNSGLSKSEAEKEVLKYSSRPGQSEHQTGLCVDFTTKSIGGVVEREFEDTEAFLWLSQNCWKYGFVLRYPEDKVEITKYDYEPWHYRFVGLEAATVMYQSGMTLEEYLEYTAE